MKTISIKSKKAENKLREDKWLDDAADCYVVYIRDAELAVELAEQEAEERMRQKAIEAFDDMWFSGMEPDYECHLNNFIQKLTEQ